MSEIRGTVSVFIYERELEFLKWLVLQKRDIETGGDLFGLWQDKDTAVVQLILGPGAKCKRTPTSFHQDVDYLADSGEYLTSTHGLCNIGEWHSHHRLGLAEPSAGDERTVWGHLPDCGRYIVFIANIRGNPENVNVGCFLFSSSERKMLRGNIRSLPYPSPIRQSLGNTSITTKAEAGQNWSTFSSKPRTKRRHSDDNPDYFGRNSETEQLLGHDSGQNASNETHGNGHRKRKKYSKCFKIFCGLLVAIAVVIVITVVIVLT